MNEDRERDKKDQAATTASELLAIAMLEDRERNKRALRGCWACTVFLIFITVAFFSLLMVGAATNSPLAAFVTFACILIIGGIVAYKMVVKK